VNVKEGAAFDPRPSNWANFSNQERATQTLDDDHTDNGKDDTDKNLPPRLVRSKDTATQ
jgi:hypothetical protein